MGGGAEDSYTVLGRSGAVPYVLSKDLLIPAGTKPVQVEFVSRKGQKVAPLMGGNVGIENVTINGVEGTLSIDAESRRRKIYKYYFKYTLYFFFFLFSSILYILKI